MNAYCPQSISTGIEIAYIAAVRKHIISARYSEPIITLKQDSVVGAFLMTDKNVEMDWHDIMNIMLNCNNVAYDKITKNNMNTYDIYSMILPPMINIFEGDKLSIVNSNLTKGVISGSIINNKILNVSWDRYGPDKTKDFIDNSQRLIINYLLQAGFTVGLGDCIINPENKLEIRKVLQESSLNVQHLITEIENYPDLLDPVTFENDIRDILSNTTKGELIKMVYNKLNSSNNFYAMIASKAKGKDENLSQIIGGLAQSILEFARIRKRVNNRALVHLCQNDDTAEGRGFIANSYYDGLSPQEFFFHHMAGREGLIDTAIKTADTGYLQRKLVKAMEDMHIAYDGTVRSGNNIVIQMLFADSHLDQIMQKSVKMNILTWGNQKILEISKFTDDQVADIIAKCKYNSQQRKEFTEFNEEVVDIMKQFRDDLRVIQIKASVTNVIVKEYFYQPANYMRIINDAKNSNTIENTQLDPMYVISELDRLMDPRVCRLICITDKDDENSLKYNNQLATKYLFRIALYEYLGPKRCLYEYKFNKEKFDSVIVEIINSFNNSTVEPGEMVGVAASQSLGEPLTQMTLNSIDWEDEIIYKCDEILHESKIGLFVDDLFDKNKNSMVMIDNNTQTEYLEVAHMQITVPTVNENGCVSYKLLEAVTRHLPGHNGKLVKIITKLGLHVSASKSKSFLTLIDNKLIDIDGDKIRVGDCVPVDLMFNGNINKTLHIDKMFGNVYIDEIISIEEVLPSREKVYDFTVAETRNFTLANGLCVRDTFHSTGAGVAGMQGVPRFRELLSYTKDQNTPYMVIYMDAENRENRNAAHKIASVLKYTILNELTEQMDIIYEPDSKTASTSFYNTDDIDTESVFFLNNMSSTAIENMPWIFRAVLSNNSIVENEITMSDIKTRFITFWNQNYNDLSAVKHDKNIIAKILHGCVMTSYDYSTNNNLIVHFRFELSNVDNATLHGIRDILLNKFNIKGNENIKKTKIEQQTYISYNNEDQIPESTKEWVIYTDGIDMNLIRDIIGIDINRTYCNSIQHTYLTFGIEAARISLIKEFENVYGSTKINYAHIELLSDVMTNTGGITSIDRHGINRLDTDPLGRASFEKQIEQLLLASAFNETDYLRGVSSRIIVGKCIKGGTGICDLLIDVNMIENSEINETKEIKQLGTEYNVLTKSTLLSDLIKKARRQ